jgi:predicted transposase YdaD
LYLDLILISLATSARQALEDTMNSLGYEYQSDFARRYFGEGKAEGKVEGKAEGKTEGLIERRMEGRVELILELLARRFGALPDGIRTRVRCAQEAQLGAVTERMLTAQTLEQALDSLY